MRTPTNEVEYCDFDVKEVEIKQEGTMFKVTYQETHDDSGEKYPYQKTKSWEDHLNNNADIFKYMKQLSVFVPTLEKNVSVIKIKLKHEENEMTEINFKFSFKKDDAEKLSTAQTPYKAISSFVRDEKLRKLLEEIKSNLYKFCIHDEYFEPESATSKMRGDKMTFSS